MNFEKFVAVFIASGFLVSVSSFGIFENPEMPTGEIVKKEKEAVDGWKSFETGKVWSKESVSGVKTAEESGRTSYWSESERSARERQEVPESVLNYEDAGGLGWEKSVEVKSGAGASGAGSGIGGGPGGGVGGKWIEDGVQAERKEMKIVSGQTLSEKEEDERIYFAMIFLYSVLAVLLVILLLCIKEMEKVLREKT